MNQAQLLQDFETLPPNIQQEVINFIAFVKQHHEQRIVRDKPSLDLSQFHFAQSRKRLKHLKSSLSDTLIDEI